MTKIPVKHSLKYMVLATYLFLSSCAEDKTTKEPISFFGDSIAIVQNKQPSISDTVYQLSDCDSAPSLLSHEVPEYPTEEAKAGIEGSVWFRLIVSPEGIPVKAELIRSSRKSFNRIALESIMSSKFNPAQKSGKPVYCWFNFPIGFRMRKQNK